MSNIQRFTYEKQTIEFDITNNNVMVNATEMAKLFDKRIDVFLKTEPTKAFILAAKFTPTGVNLGIRGDADLIQTKGRNGTFFHRILALKFAAWLDAEFELWVYATIEEVLFGNYRRFEADLKESADRRNQINALRTHLMAAPDYQRLQELELQEKQAAYARSKYNKDQLSLFQAVSSLE